MPTENVTIMDEHLALLGRKRLPIKADGHCLLREIYAGMKKNQLLPSCLSDKQLFRGAVHDVISFDKYNDFIIDAGVETVYHVQQYEEKKVYNSNIGDVL